MNEPGMVEPPSPAAAAAPVIKLWTPRNIFWLGVFLGWPTSLVLCIINWFRMGLWKKAFIFIPVGLVTIIIFFWTSAQLPDNASQLPLLLINLLLLFSFQALMNIDFRSLGFSSASFRKAGVGQGILIGILTLLVLFASLFVVSVFIEMVKIFLNPSPINPLPGKESWKEIPVAALSLKPW